MNHATGDFFLSSHHAILYHIPAQNVLSSSLPQLFSQAFFFLEI
jgi:hypothetical protein